VYVGKFAAWTQSQTDDIEKICTQTYKKLSQNNYSFPDALIYLPRDLGGFGFQKLYDIINSAKYSIL